VVRNSFRIRVRIAGLAAIGAAFIGALMVGVASGEASVSAQRIGISVAIVVGISVIAVLGERSKLIIDLDKIQMFSRRGTRQWQIYRGEVSGVWFIATQSGGELVFYQRAGVVLRRSNYIPGGWGKLVEALQKNQWPLGEPSSHNTNIHPPAEISFLKRVMTCLFFAL
jgi:hypothetical protein